jgi:NAD(P)H dehydrogenase (quinone)
MKHAVIVGHPGRASFNLAVSGAYAGAVRARGGEALVRDLYGLNFDPCLRAEEVPGPGGFTPGDDVFAERALLADVGVFAFVYPFWFNAPPAIVKGYVDRVFGMGFGYGPIEGGRNAQLLSGRRMISFTTSGGPTEWLMQQGSLTALRNLFDAHVAAVTGLGVVDHVHFGAVTPDLAPDRAAAMLAEVARTVERYF